MPTPAELTRERKRRRRRRWIAALVGVPALIYCVNVALTYTDVYESVPESAWQHADFSAIARADRHGPGQGPAAETPLAPPTADSTAPPVAPAPPQVKEAAELWVRAMNNANPQSILHHDVDARGNLYVVIGAWWLTLTPDQQMQALDQLGRYWRGYLHDAFGQWDVDGAFAPGIVIVDSKGEVAHNLNGKVVIRRQPRY